jgi:hypothetical protein
LAEYIKTAFPLNAKGPDHDPIYTTVAREAGFSNLRRAAQTPVNLILELTP